MNTNMTKVMIGAGLLFALGACSDRFIEPPPLGGSVAQNKAAQIVNPKPVPTDEPPEFNGERDVGAMQRYEKGKVIEPKANNTTGGSSSSTSGSN